MEGILDFHREASEVLVNFSIKLAELFVESGLKEFSQLVEDHSHMEAGQASLEADLAAVLFHDDLLAFVGLIGVVEFWNLPDDPEGLSVKLLFEVGIQQVGHLVLVADDNERQQVTQGWGEVLDSLAGLADELFKLLVDLVPDGRAHLDEHREEAIEVDKASDSYDRAVLGFVHDLNHVCDDQLGHDLKDHAWLEVLAGAALGHEADCRLHQVNEPLVRVDRLDLGLVLLRLGIKHLLLDLVRLSLAEEERQPVSEPFVRDRSTDLVLRESLQAQQVKSRVDIPDLASSWQTRK